MRFPLRAACRALVAGGVGILGLVPWATAAAGPGTPDTLITGHVAPGQPGRHIGITVDRIACPIVAGGIVDSLGGYQVVVTSCGPGTAMVTIDGAATSTTFTTRPGVWVNLDRIAASGAHSPASTPTRAPSARPTPTPRPVRPGTTPSATPSSTFGGLSIPDGLVIGTISGAQSGQRVSVRAGERGCVSVAGGIADNKGAFALVVGNCGPGSASLLLDGTATGITFTTHPGGVVTVRGALKPH